MREFAVHQEEARLSGGEDSAVYPEFKERHRIFPTVFERRNHKKILDTSAGIGYAAQRILENYPAKVFCNEISPVCFANLRRIGAPIVSFDLDDTTAAFPFSDGCFDAVISLVTIEHLLNIDYFVKEINRILCNGGYLYITTPNYAAPEYLINPVLYGKSFHDPLAESSRYEFFAHLRYFTYKTLLEFVSAFGFVPDTVYIARPGGSSRYRKLYENSRLKARIFRFAMSLRHNLLPPSWASEPVVCFQKANRKLSRTIRKIVL